MNTTNEKANELWTSKWASETHTTEYAKKRIKSAQSAKLTPIRIDTEDLYGYFQGSSGRYETFLDYCPCGDFHRSKLPCKHIYRLAIELGLMNISADNNINSVLTPKVERINLSDTIDIVETLSENAQRQLLNISSGLNSATPICYVSSQTDITELLHSGIVIETEPHIIKFRNKTDTISFLNEEQIPYNNKAKKTELEELCKEKAFKQAEMKFGYLRQISIPTKFSSQNIHNYLHRKYDSELYYSIEDNDFLECNLLDTVLPNDNVTDQLIKRGYYSINSPKIQIDR